MAQEQQHFHPRTLNIVEFYLLMCVANLWNNIGWCWKVLNKIWLPFDLTPFNISFVLRCEKQCWIQCDERCGCSSWFIMIGLLYHLSHDIVTLISIATFWLLTAGLHQVMVSTTYNTCPVNIIACWRPAVSSRNVAAHIKVTISWDKAKLTMLNSLGWRVQQCWAHADVGNS